MKVRGCVACGQEDDHPRHVIAQGDASVPWHQDCHAAMGCEVCKATVDSADGIKGDELRAHILSGGAAAAVAAVLGEDK